MSLLYTTTQEDHATRLQKLWQYRLQFEFMMPAAMVFVAGGMKLAWSLYELPSAPYDYNHPNFLTIVWFSGLIFGVFVASFFVGRVRKNISHTLSGFLLVAGGIIFIIMPTTFIAIACSCILEGSAFGILQLQAFATGAEVANKDIRGLVMSTERCFIWLGIMVQLTSTYSWYALEPAAGHTMHMDQIHGFAVACLGITTILWSLKLKVESPLLLLKQQRDEAADMVLRQFHGTRTTYTELLYMRENYLQLLSLDADNSRWYIFRMYNMLPLLKLLILRCFVALSMSQPFNKIFLSASWLGFDCDMNCLYILTLAGLLGSLVGGLIIDRYGRRKLCLATLLLATVFMFVAAGLLSYQPQAELAFVSSDLEIVSILLLLYQLIISTGISTAATVYLSEAFTVTQKTKCIAIVLVAENLLQILLTVNTFQMTVSAAAMLFSIGTVGLPLLLYAFLWMPETKNLTLYECLLKFKGLSLRK